MPTKGKTYQLLISEPEGESIVGGLEIRVRVPVWRRLPSWGAHRLQDILLSHVAPVSGFHSDRKDTLTNWGQGMPQSHAMQQMSLGRCIGGEGYAEAASNGR